MFYKVELNINYGFQIILFNLVALFLLTIKQLLNDFQYQLNN